VLQNVNELSHKKSASQFLQMLTIMTAFISPYLPFMPTSLGRFLSLRGGKGNNLFYSTKTFFGIFKIFSAQYLSFSLIHPNYKYHSYIPQS